MRSRQLTFVFADSPQGGKEAGPPDVSHGKALLLHITKGKATSGLIAPAADTDRLLEQAASASTLATALLNVVRNKGAPGVDEVVGAARSLMPRFSSLAWDAHGNRPSKVSAHDYHPSLVG
jgi:hypothetical protein